MHQQLEGANIAAKELAQDANEARAKLAEQMEASKKTEENLSKVNEELRTYRTVAEVDAKIRSLAMDFKIHEHDVVEFNWWALTFGLLITAALWLGLRDERYAVTFAVALCGLFYLYYMNRQAARIRDDGSVARYHYIKGHKLFGHALWRTWTCGTRIQTVRFDDAPAGPDLRPDSNALVDVKHKNPMYGEILMTREELEYDDPEREKRLFVSFEMIAQLTAPKYMTFAADDKTALTRMVTAAEKLQLVNFNRYDSFHGRNVCMNSALVAWTLWCRQQENDLLDFAGAPSV